MADSEQVYRIRFNSRDAIKGIDKIEDRIEALENKIVKAFGGQRVRTAISRFNGLVTATASAVAKTSKTIVASQEKVARGFDRSSKNANKAAKQFLNMGISGKTATDRVATGGRRVERSLARAGRTGKSATDKIALGSRRAERSLRRVGVASNSVSMSMGALAGKVALLIGAAQGIRSIGSNFLGFDKSMTLAGAKFSKLEPSMTPGTRAFKEFRKEIRGATKDMEHTAESVAGAVDFWAKAGKSSEQAKAVIPITGDFASANTNAAGSMLEMSEAGDILSDTLGQFQMDSADPTELLKNTTRVADVMSAAANTANFSATELFESFKTAGPILTAVGGDIEETSALLAVMANAGLKSSIAGRSLKIATAAINDPTKSKLYEKYNIITKDSQGNMLKLTDIIGQLDFATRKLGTGERFGVFAKMFGRQGVTGFLNLLAKGRNEISKTTSDFRALSGETKRLAEITRTSATAQMQRFWNKISNLGFTLIEETNLFGKLGKAVDGVDWKKAADFVMNKMVPAVNKVGRIIRNVLYPALVMTAENVKTLFAPALLAIEKLFGKTGESGEGLAKVLSYLGTLWVAHKGYLLAVKAVGMIQWFTSLIVKISAAGTAQGVLNAKTIATNRSLMASVKGFGALNSMMGVFAAGVAGWTIGTIIHDQLVDPLMKATQELERLKAEIADTEKRGIENRNSAMLEEDKKTAEKAIKLQKDTSKKTDWMMQTATGMGGYGFGIAEKDKSDTKEVKRLDTFKTNVEEQILIKKTEENIKRFDTEELPQSVAPTQFDLPDQFGHGAYLDTGESDILPEQGVQTIFVENVAPMKSPSGEFSPGVQSNFVPSEPINKVQSIQEYISPGVQQDVEQWAPIQDVTMDMLVDGQKEQLKLQERAAADTRAFQSAMMAANTKSGKATTVQYNYTTGDTHVNIPVQSGDPAALSRAVERAIRDANHKAEIDVKNRSSKIVAPEI